jgi:uncharacterized surface protein with fasciclin (FAS1) repeats
LRVKHTQPDRALQIAAKALPALVVIPPVLQPRLTNASPVSFICSLSAWKKLKPGRSELSQMGADAMASRISLNFIQKGAPMKSLSKLIAGTALTLTASVASAADIVDIAVANGNFKTLVKAVQEAGLVDTLKGEGPFTVFAPTDEAFAKLPPGALQGLLKDKTKLAQVLTYHVVAGKVMAADIKPGQVKTVEGQPVRLQVKGGEVMVNNAKVTQADVVASNGVIHVIDKVIMPN